MKQRISLCCPRVHQMDKAMDLLPERQFSDRLPGQLGYQVEQVADDLQDLTDVKLDKCIVCTYIVNYNYWQGNQHQDLVKYLQSVHYLIPGLLLPLVHRGHLQQGGAVA